MSNPVPVFAAFVVVRVGAGFAATTRAPDRGEAGRIGLPGGKLDAGESALEAVMRESAEEGWRIAGVSPTPIHEATVDGRKVVWFRADSAERLAVYKESHRIQTFVATRNDVRGSGYGNDQLPI